MISLNQPFHSADRKDGDLLWQDFLRAITLHLDKSCTADTPEEGFDAELAIFLHLPFCRAASLFLIDPSTCAFHHYLSSPPEAEEKARKKFNRLLAAGKITEAVYSSQGFSSCSTTAGQRKKYEVILPLSDGSALLGVLILCADLPVENWEPHLLPLCRIQARHLANIIRGKSLARQLRNEKTLLRQKISQRTVGLEQAQKELKTILDTVKTGIVIIDRETRRIINVNRTALEMTGRLQEELLGSPCRDFCLVEEDPCPFFQENGTSVPEQIETSLLKPNGSVVPVWKSAAPLFIGSRACWVESWVDLTERKELERAFLQSQKLEAVGRLAGGVAHDFNNLLMAIMGYCDLSLTDLNPESPVYHYIEEISKAAERAAGLTRQLLALSRRQVQHPTILNLNDLLNDIQQLLLRIIGEDITLTTRLERGLGLVKADKSQLEQVVINLTVNARDAMPRGGELIFETYNFDTDLYYLDRRSVVTPGSYVVLAVSDNGEGMDPETRNRIFEPFFTTKDPGQGTGLGMSTVYGIVKQSGGYIWVYSEKGHGTTIKVYLPRVSDILEIPEEGSKAAPPPRGFETVLLIEDEPILRTSIKESLEAFGYRVLAAADGQQALSLARRFPETIHLILSDLIMPGKCGTETAESVLRVHPESAILYMSGYTNELVMKKGLLTDPNAFLQKPFTPTELAFKVREILDQQSGR